MLSLAEMSLIMGLWSITLPRDNHGVDLNLGIQPITMRIPVTGRMLRNELDGTPFREGRLDITGMPSDMAIVGPGCFLVRDVTTRELFATRAGMFC